MKITPEFVQALNKLHKDHHHDLLKIKEYLSKMVVEKTSGKGYEHYYIPTSDLLNIINPILCECGLSMNSMFQGDDMVTVLSHQSGGYFVSRTYISVLREGKDPDGVQWRASRFTILRRTAILGLLNIDDGSPDDDGNISERNYHGKSQNEIIDVKGQEVVEGVKKKLESMKVKPVASQEGKKKGRPRKINEE